MPRKSRLQKKTIQVEEEDDDLELSVEEESPPPKSRARRASGRKKASKRVEEEEEVESDKENQRGQQPKRSGKRTPSTPSRSSSSSVTIMLQKPGTKSPFKSPVKSPFALNRKFVSPAHNNRVRTLRTREDLDAMVMQCIKLSQTGKISEKNAWDLNLTSHLDDVVFQPTEDQKTNFQMASCALDASVRIWGARVDSVHAETFSTLSLLHQTESKKKGGSEAVGEEESQGQVTKKSQPRQPKKVQTIEQSTESLNFKELEKEICIDPLLRKASAAFDESGVKGLLLNNVPVREGSKLTFDSCDVIESAPPPPQQKPSDSSVSSEILDFFQGNEARNLQRLKICGHYAQFSFNDWSIDRPVNQSQIDPQSSIEEEDDISPSSSLEKDEIEQQQETFFDCPQDVYEPTSWDTMNTGGGDGDGGFYEGDDMGGGGFMDDEEDVPSGGDWIAGGEERLATQGESGEGEEEVRVWSAAKGAGSKVTTAKKFEDIYRSFDLKNVKNWAGPDHWKFPQPVRVAPATGSSSSETEGEKGEVPQKKTKEKKPRLFFDFSQPIDQETVFATSRASTTLTKAAMEKASHTPTTLPVDTHYRTTNLLRLFLKPKWHVKQTKDVPEENAEHDQSQEEEGCIRGQNESLFQYDADKENQVGNFAGPAFGDGVDHNDDDSDGEGFGGGGFGPEESFFSSDVTLNTTPLDWKEDIAPDYQLDVVKINFSKTPKQVDIKSLKNSIWQTIQVEEEEKNEKEDQKGESELSFQKMLEDLPEHLGQRNSLSQISVPFCFICMLHLANEKGLALTQPEGSMSEILISHDRANPEDSPSSP